MAMTHRSGRDCQIRRRDKATKKQFFNFTENRAVRRIIIYSSLSLYCYIPLIAILIKRKNNVWGTLLATTCDLPYSRTLGELEI